MSAINQLLSTQLSKLYNLLFQWLLPSNVDMALCAGLAISREQAVLASMGLNSCTLYGWLPEYRNQCCDVNTYTHTPHHTTENQANGDARHQPAQRESVKGWDTRALVLWAGLHTLAGLATQALSSRKQSSDWHREIFIFLDSIVVAFKLVHPFSFLRHPSGQSSLGSVADTDLPTNYQQAVISS